ncbi:FUSC family protein [Salinicola lusitanus]|uniref:FUSC family protein n=1 Tax=Salinicola lusitanus TaxID=1949085 RepID=UPI000DA21D8A|nr:FUSC family protein [Salinicola lusitanus]
MCSAPVNPTPPVTPAQPYAALIRCLSCCDLTTPRATYVLRSVLAAWLALVLAYWFDLEAPYSAASSVLLVINPVQGAVIGKGIWRVIGTLAGMLAALVLMSLFGQMPWLFLLGFGVWFGLCVAGMTLVRHFRAYGAALAGYTVGLAVYGALEQPQTTFAHVVDRGSAVLIGVMCLALVSSLFSARRVRQRLEAQSTRLLAASAETLATQHEALEEGIEGGPTRVAPARRKLIAEVYGIDDLLALGKAESIDLAQQGAMVRHAMASLFAALVGGISPLSEHSTSMRALRALQPELERSWRDAASDVSAGDFGKARRRLCESRERLMARLESVSSVPAEQPALLIAGDRLVEQIDDYLAALDGIATLHRPGVRPILPAVPFHRDWTAAMQNGLRAMLIVVLGGIFWIATGWQHGNMMLAGLAAACALLSTAPNPAAGAIAFIKGTLAAVVMAFVCAFGVLPHIEGLFLLLIVLGLFWLPAVFLTTLPRHALAGMAYLVGFTTLAAPANPMQYDLSLFLNASVAWLLAVFFTLLGFRLLLPRNLARDIERLRHRIRDEALSLLRRAPTDERRWQWRQQHRMARLGAVLQNQPVAMDHAISDALASLHLGRELMRLRHWLKASPKRSPIRPTVEKTLKRMACRADDPLMAARHARRAARLMMAAGVVESGRVENRQYMAAALIEVAELIEGHADYFFGLPRGGANAQ